MVNVPNPFRAEDDVPAPAGGIRWEDPKSATLDEVDENATRHLPAVTPGKSILKTPGAKTPGARRWNNNPNAKFRVTSPVAAKTPARTPGRSLALAKTPGRGPRTPGGSRFSQAPERVEVKAKTPRRTHHHQLMILRERPKTPGRVGPDGELVEEDPNPAAALRSLPNATQAAYWLRRSAREERAGNLDEAMSFIEQGIKRHAEPNEELVAAREALAAKMEFAKLEAEAAAEAERAADDAASSKTPAKRGGTPGKQLPSTPASAAKTAASIGEVSTPLSGSVVIVTPVRASPRVRDSLDCGEKVLTPVRRSARKATPQSLEPGSMASMLESTGFAYVPNEALKPNEPEDEDGQADEVGEDDDAAAALPAAEEEDLAALPAPDEDETVALPAPDTFGGFATAEETKSALAEEARVAAERRFESARVEANRAADAAVVALRAASPAPAVVVGGDGNGTPKGTPKGTPGRMSRVTYADRTPPTDAARRISYGGVVVSSSEAAEAARVAEEEEHAAKEAATAMLMRQESVRAGCTPVNISPRKPPKSPGGKKASALARAAAMAAASVEPSPGAANAGAVSTPAAPSPAGSMVSPSVLMPSLPTPTLDAGGEKTAAVESVSEPVATPPAATRSPRPGPSPGKAAREAAESEGVDPVDAVADAVANATPGSVTDRRKRRVASPAGVNEAPSEMEAVGTSASAGDAASTAAAAATSPRRAALPETPFGEPRAFASPELSRVTPVAPNAARLIATPGKHKSTSPLSVFARMMAKVIVDAANDVDDQKAKLAEPAIEPATEPVAAPAISTVSAVSATPEVSSPASRRLSVRTPASAVAASAPGGGRVARSAGRDGSARETTPTTRGRVASAAAAALMDTPESAPGSGLRRSKRLSSSNTPK